MIGLDIPYLSPKWVIFVLLVRLGETVPLVALEVSFETPTQREDQKTNPSRWDKQYLDIQVMMVMVLEIRLNYREMELEAYLLGIVRLDIQYRLKQFCARPMLPTIYMY